MNISKWKFYFMDKYLYFSLLSCLFIFVHQKTHIDIFMSIALIFLSLTVYGIYDSAKNSNRKDAIAIYILFWVMTILSVLSFGRDFVALI